MVPRLPGKARASPLRARVAKRRRSEKTPSTSTMSDNPRSPRGGAQTRPASERTPSSHEVPSKLRSTTTTSFPAGAAAARASGGGALPFASGGELPDDPPVPPAAAPEVHAAPSAVGGARGRPRRVLSRWVKKGSVVAPNASARRDSLGSDGVSHRPVLVPRPPLLGDEARASPSEETEDRRRCDGEILPEGYETDACYFVDLYEDLESIVDPAFRRAHDALEDYYARVKEATSDVIPWTRDDKKRYLCGNPQGIVCAHYSPSVEAGPVTNVGINVHMSASAKDGERTRAKQKAVCLRFQSQAIASETAERGDGYTVTRVVEPVEGVPDATVERFVAVENSSAALLYFDVFERWPCVDANDVDIEDAVRKRLGNEFLVEGDNLFANLIEARRRYVAKKGGGEPPVMVWNRGTMDGETFRGAQVGTFEALKITCREENVWSTYHMAFMMRKSLAVKVAALYADAAMRGFISRARQGALTFPKARRDGFWAFFHEIAELTDEERRRMREELHALMRDLGKRGGKIVSDAWEAVRYDSEHGTTTATDEQRDIVERGKRGGERGGENVSDALEAVRYDFEHGTTTATDEQLDIAERWFAPKMKRWGKNPAEIIIWRNQDAAFAALEAGKGGSVPTRVPGFVNLGNTCYLAATAQMLCGLDAFAGDVAGLPDAYLNATPEGAGGSARDAPSFDGVAGAARDLVRAREAHAARFDDAATRASATAALVPARLKRAVQRRRPRYEGYEQHDAHEFLCDALDALAEEVADAERSERGFKDSGARTDARRSIGSLASSSEWVPLHRTRCPTRRAFTGASAVTLTCETCGDASTSVESFRHLSLEIPPSETFENFESAPLELQALIARCFASETVERRCARAGCGGTRAAMARRLLRAPRALLVHLKRFRAEDASRETCGDASFLPSVAGDSQRGYSANAFAPPRLTKNARPVSLPETVTLAPFADAAVRGPPIASAETSGGDGRSASLADPDLSADEAAAATRTYAADDSAAGEAARAQLASYRLAGVVSHLGDSMCEGHYVASVRVDDVGGETTGKCWMFFDDKTVRVVESPAYAESTPKDWYLAVFEYAPDSGETVADAAFPARAAAPTKTKGGAKLKDPAQGECASEPGAFQIKTIADACKYLLEVAGDDGLSIQTLSQEIQKLFKRDTPIPYKSVANILSTDERFKRVKRGVYALATPEDSSSYRLSALAAKNWIQEAYLGDGNGEFVPGDGEDDVEILKVPGRLVPLKASDGYSAVFRVYSMRAVMSPTDSLYSDVYNVLCNECEFRKYSTGGGYVEGKLPVGTGTCVSSKAMTFLKSFLYKVRNLTDADVNAKNAAASARKKEAKKAKRAKKMNKMKKRAK